MPFRLRAPFTAAVDVAVAALRAARFESPLATTQERASAGPIVGDTVLPLTLFPHRTTGGN